MGNSTNNSGGGGGFHFNDDEPKKPARFEFTVQEVSEKDLKRQAKEERRGPKKILARRSDSADPGTWEWPMVAALILAVPLVIWLQQWSLSLHGETLESAPLEVQRSEAVEDPGVGELAIWSKLSVKMAFLSEQTNERPQHKPLGAQERQEKPTKSDTTSKPGASKSGAKSTDDEYEDEIYFEYDEDEAREEFAQLEQLAWSRTDRLRVAIVAGELLGAQEALTRLTTLEKEADAGGDMANELHWLKKVYQEGPETIPAEAVESLQARHGWFGSLAVSFGKHASDDVRWQTVSGGTRVYTLLGITYGVNGLVLLGGIYLCIFSFLKLGTIGYTLRFEAPAPGGSVYLETFVVFVSGFAVLLLAQLMFFGLDAEGTTTAAALSEILMWSLLLTAFWPLARGVSWREWSDSLGLHTGEGVVREMICGCGAYIAAQPLLILGNLAGGVLEKLVQGETPEESFGYGMFDAPAEGSWVLFILGILSAVIWAPIIEEIVFRGALFRYLSSRMRLIWVALITSILFGLIHPYTTQGLVSVAIGGLAFAFMRAWRGSLIAPMTAHALHNILASSMTFGLVSVLE